jgi:hypothetical protein
MSGGFLSRWSRLKRGIPVDPAVTPPSATAAAVSAGTSDSAVSKPFDPSGANRAHCADAAVVRPTDSAADPGPADAAATRDAAHSTSGLRAADACGTDPSSVALAARDDGAARTPAAASLPDLASLTPESDFTPFMRKGVDAVQQNAALKKLFTDPHFNVMDGLDIYIDDYSRPDPISAEVLRQLVQSDVLGLFRPLHGSGEPGEHSVVDTKTGQAAADVETGEPAAADPGESADGKAVFADAGLPAAGGVSEAVAPAADAPAHLESDRRILVSAIPAAPPTTPGAAE